MSLRFFWYQIECRGVRRKFSHLLSAYPVYTPPFRANEYRLSPAHSAQNFQHFMRTKEDRLRTLWHFLGDAGAPIFGELRFDPSSLQLVSEFLAANGYYLLDVHPEEKARAVERAFATYESWTGSLAPLNVVFDMGTFAGEWLVRNVTGVHWDLDPPGLLVPEVPFILNHMGGMLKGMPNHRVWYPIASSFRCSQTTGIRLKDSLENALHRPRH
jgi:hypothetical protein